MPLAARLAGLAALGVMLGLVPANRLLTRLGLRRWRLAALFLPGFGPLVFLWLVAFSGAREQDDPDSERDRGNLGMQSQQQG
jgi:MFS family permease